MIKINSLILILLILFLILNNKKKEKYDNTEKNEKNEKSINKNSYKIVSNEKFSAFKKNDYLDKSSKKYNLENKITLENHNAKKINFNYDEIEDINNKKIKNFKYDNNNEINENFTYDINEIPIYQENDYIRKKSDKLVDKSTKFYKIDDKNELLLQKIMNKKDVKIEFEPFNKNIFERSKTSKPYKKPFTSSQLKNYKGKTIKEIYNSITKNNFNVRKDTNIFGFKN
jgi:hypothetical protein